MHSLLDWNRHASYQQFISIDIKLYACITLMVPYQYVD